MPFQSISCTNCGSGNIQEVKPDTYFCNHCEGVFKYAAVSRAPEARSCEVLVDGRECGVPAIGRCATDGRAFCRTHQAANLHTRYDDQCQPCLSAEIEKRNAISKHESEAVWHEYDTMQEIVKQLDGVASPLRKVYHAHTSKRGPFGRYRDVDDPSGHIYGWPAGEYEWEFYDSYRGRTYNQTVKTFVTREGDFVALDRQGKPDISRADTEYRSVSRPSWRGGPTRLLTNESRPKAEFLREINGKLRSLLSQI